MLSVTGTLKRGEWLRTVDDFDRLQPGSHYMTQYGYIIKDDSAMFEEVESKTWRLLRRLFGRKLFHEPLIMSDEVIAERYLPAYVVMTPSESPFFNGIPPEASEAYIKDVYNARFKLEIGGVVRTGDGDLAEVVDLDDGDGITLSRIGLHIIGADTIALEDAVYPLIELTPKGM